MGVHVFSTTLEKSNKWVKDLMNILDWEDEEKTYLALKATLQPLRDRLTLKETAHLSSQLPMILRGMFLEGWRPDDQPVKYDKDEYLNLAKKYFQNDPALDIEKVVKGVFSLLAKKISDGEIEDIKGILPKDMKGLLP